MSGIAGIYHADGRPVEQVVLERMLQRLAARGPDAAGVWADGPIGLGHRMHWTTPEAWHELQPLRTDDGQVHLVADARVDNPSDLQRDLSERGFQLRALTDAELILQSYECWGEGCPEKIIGDFAFVIWDGRQRRLFAARDPLGIKPLFYHFDGRSFYFASTPIALLGSGVMDRQPNVEAVSRALLHEFNDRQETLYQGILRLPAAHRLELAASRLHHVRYWQLDPDHAIRRHSDDDYADEFLELLRTAVAARMRSHGPVGALLSGGLDSSSVVSLAQQLMDSQRIRAEGFRAFSVVFDDMPCDERTFINDVARKCGVTVQQFVYGAHPSWLDFETTRAYPDVLYIPTLYLLGPIFQHAQEAGIRTVLTGHGGDDVTASTVLHLADLARQHRFGDLYRQVTHDARLMSCSRWSLLRDYCLKPLTPQPIRSAFRSVVPAKRGRGPNWVTEKARRMAARQNSPNPELPRPAFATIAQQRLFDKLEFGWNANIAREQIDAFAAYFSIECRHPFFDRRVIEFMIAVPEDQRWMGPSRKVILRRAMAGILPESVRGRNSKATFGPVLDHEFKVRQVQKMESLLRDSILSNMGLIDVPEFRRMYQEFLRPAVPNGAWRACQTFVALEQWLRQDAAPSR